MCVLMHACVCVRRWYSSALGHWAANNIIYTHTGVNYQHLFIHEQLSVGDDIMNNIIKTNTQNAIHSRKGGRWALIRMLSLTIGSGTVQIEHSLACLEVKDDCPCSRIGGHHLVKVGGYKIH